MWYGGLRGAIGLALALLTQLNPLGDEAQNAQELRYK